VGKGETVLELDTVQIRRQIGSAENERTAAKANLEKAQSGFEAARRADALALKMQEEELKNAQSGLTWWEKVDGKQMLQSAEMSAQNAKDSVERPAG